MQYTMANDRNFDDLAHRFKRNIYDDLKGRVRLAVLGQDFNEFLPDVFNDQKAPVAPLSIFDAGGGQGQFSLPLAQLGHNVVICDVSQEMLKHAFSEAQRLGVQDNVILFHGSIQQYLSENNGAQFDLILCHAVLEWVVEQQALLQLLSQYLRPEGFLSLTFYNIHSLVYKNLLRANYKKIRKDELRGFRRSLTPTYPLEPTSVEAWLAELPLQSLCVSGIRCFHDYMFDAAVREGDAEGLVEMELRFSRQLPYRLMARYIHVLSQKSAD